MSFWQLCANLLIPNCLRSNLSYSPLAALELYVNFAKEMLVGSKMDKACELAEKYKGRDSYSEIYKAIKKVSESLQ